jgi:hypothetical protein
MGVVTQAINLSGQWIRQQAIKPETIPATVLGCIHTDFLASGEIPDLITGITKAARN